VAKAKERIQLATVRAGVTAPYLAASAQLPLTGEDALRLNVTNGGGLATVVLSGRYALPDTQAVDAFEDRLIVPATRLEVTKVTSVGAVSLLNLHIRTSGVSVSPGQIFARLEVVRGDGAGLVLGVLLAGYIGSWGGLSWPGTPLRGAQDGAGTVKQITDNTPTGGTERSVSLPVRTRWRVIGAAGVLACSGVAGTRRPYLRLKQEAQTIWQAPSSLTPGAGSTVLHSWGAGVPLQNDPSSLVGLGSIPDDLFLQTGDTANSGIDTITVGIDASDVWNPFVVLVEEWLNPTTKFS
jgi:hypothetical protein